VFAELTACHCVLALAVPCTPFIRSIRAKLESRMATRYNTNDLRQSAESALKKAQAWVDVVEGCTAPYVIHQATEERKDE
jgi:hypothetical protein